MDWFPVLPLLHFLAFILYFSLILYVLYLDPRAAANRAAAAMFAGLAVWSGTMIFIHNSGTPRPVAEAAFKVYVLSWIMIAPISLLLFSALADRNRYLKNPLILSLVFLPGLIFYCICLNGGLLEPITRFDSGWLAEWKDNAAVYSFYIWYSLLIFYGVYLLHSTLKSLKNEMVKKQNIILISTCVITLFGVVFVTAVLPLLNKKLTFVGDLSDLIMLIWVGGIIYSIFFLKLFKLSVSFAADRIIADMNEFLVLVDPDMNINHINSPLSEFLGYAPNELKGRPFRFLVHRDTDISTMPDWIFKASGCRVQDFCFKKKNGEKVTVILSISLLKEMNEVVGILFLASDITEITKAKETAKEAYEKLKEVDLLKSNFTSIVSHELRTPLTSIKGFLSFLLSGMTGPLNPQQLEYLEIIRHNSDRLLSLINDLLDISKMESGNFSIEKHCESITSVLNTCTTDVKSLSDDKKIAVVLDMRCGDMEIYMDKHRIAQAVINLLSNSIKFSPRDSTITISYDHKDRNKINIPAYINESAVTSQTYAVISISDNGSGIEKNKISKVFDRFYQVENANNRKIQGTGLGLTIAKNIVEFHGGLIWAESEGIGKGSKFVILLPTGNSENAVPITVEQ
jgi:PAS domain S-box-containing protein